MTRDAADDPYTVAGTPDVVLACADCGEVGPIAGTRKIPGSGDVPHEPLCPDDWAIEIRVWGYSRGAHELGPPTQTREEEIGGGLGVRRLCPRCGGAGRVRGYEGTCFECLGFRWTYVFPASVRRAARWSQTFQQNRTPPEPPGKKPAQGE